MFFLCIQSADVLSHSHYFFLIHNCFFPLLTNNLIPLLKIRFSRLWIIHSISSLLYHALHILPTYMYKKKKKIYKSKIPVKLLTKRGYPLKIDVINLLDILLSHYLYVFFISSATDSTFVPTITWTLVLLNFITPFAPARFNAASFT